MKKRKSIGFRWIGNRTVIGIVCMIAAIGICFGIAPTVQKLSAGKTNILRVTRTVPRGSCLTEADVETVEVGSYGLSRDILRDKTAAVGKYATTDLYRIDENQYENGNYTVSGAFERVNEPSAHLRTLLLRAGIPWNELTRIVGHDA